MPWTRELKQNIMFQLSHNLCLPVRDTICYTVPCESEEPDGAERSHSSEIEGRENGARA